ncbi:hypothetical protein ACFQWB_00620 [Paenibacillus thermoaerophilus]|uniref:Uncharacterized protein n=1 Tax=Paenibacillus thermoaerophilus TaxID=1215385 RepID=A0ABW2UYT9_9BACL|nr:hypothetical protein [Paenibacillus thermoaerophilus]
MRQSGKMEQAAGAAAVMPGAMTEAAAMRELDGDSHSLQWLESSASHPRPNGGGGPVRR